MAMAILAASMVPLLTIQSQMAQSARRLERVDARILARSNALNALKRLNFSKLKSGEDKIGDEIMVWNAQPLEPARRTRSTNGEVGRYQVVIYKVVVQVKTDDSLEDTFEFKGLGWEPLWASGAGF